MSRIGLKKKLYLDSNHKLKALSLPLPHSSPRYLHTLKYAKLPTPGSRSPQSALRLVSLHPFHFSVSLPLISFTLPLLFQYLLQQYLPLLH